MSLLAPIQNPYVPFVGLTGTGVNSGALYIGVAGTDPQTTPQACYWDAAGTIAASQPIPISGGYPIHSGSPAQLYTASTYSIRLRDSQGTQVFYLSSFGPTIAQVSVLQFGPLQEGGSAGAIAGNDATLTAMRTWLSARNGSAEVTFPPGSYQISQESAVTTPYTVLRGQGTTILPLFQGGPFPVGHATDQSIVDSSGVENFIFAAGITQTSGSAMQFRLGQRMWYKNIRHFSFYNGAVIGAAGYAVGTPGICMLRDIYGGVSADGVILYAPAGTAIDGVSQISGLRGAGTRGINIVGAADGVYVGNHVTIADFSRGLSIHHTSGSVASVEFAGAVATPTTYFVELDLSGSATVNHLLLDGGRWFGNGATGAESGLFVNNTGTGEIIEVLWRNAALRDIAKGVATFNAPVEELTISGMSALNVSASGDGLFNGIDFGGQAHGHVIMSGNRIRGNHAVTVRPNYGLTGGAAITKASIVGFDASDAKTSPYNAGSWFTPGNNLKFSNIVGTAL